MPKKPKYPPPKCRSGDRLYCHRYGDEIEVTGFTENGWPVARWPSRGGKPSLVVTDELKLAVETESAQWLMDHFAVCENVVTLWRDLFGIGWDCPGTRQAKAARAGTYTTAGHYQPKKT